MSRILKEDVERIISDSNIPWNDLRNSAVLITGATGLIGNILVNALSAANRKYKLNIRIIAHGRNALKGKTLSLQYGVEFIAGDICESLPISLVTDRVDYIFHCAAITKSADMVAKSVEVINISIDGTRNVLELARKMKSKSIVFLSSMEVYGQTELKQVYESDLGYLDLTNPRSSYPESKRLCENMCACYWSQFGVKVKVARLARTFGAGTPNDDFDMRVAMQFARKAILREDIELHTIGNSLANCCYTADAISGLLILLLKGKNGEAYNIVNSKASVSIRQMADIIAKEICGGNINVIIKVPNDVKKLGYAPDVGFVLNSDKIEQLGWRPQYGIVEMYKRMIADWQNNER